ncbi:DUF1501 domain-containing protein [Nocardioides sp. 1609]|uniref:DUF1501 domain-containing protein n=1 Tax=Nocardioides sp. 1609 TaxID=2508327 RepID=UPI00106F88C7|nr:DUF1501 domain-containing protein [Nocardioides sp. 1609]
MTSTHQPTQHPRSCCDEYAGVQAAVSRRGLMRGALALAGASTVVGGAVVTASPAAARTASSVLVVLSLRGGADGLSLVVPHADPVYYRARPGIAVAADRLLHKDGMFGLHPALAPLTPLWQAGKVAAVHATGLPVANRSHFSAMEEVEDADPGSSTRVGWLNRLVGTTPGGSPLQGFGVGGGVLPTSLYGPSPVMSGGRVDALTIPGASGDGRKKASLRTVWKGDTSPLGRSMRSVFDAVAAGGPIRAAADHSDAYPATDLGRALSTAAQIVRGDVGVEVITVDQGDWDMHVGTGGSDDGWLARNARDLAASMAAFLGDLGDQAGKVTLVTISEFGRRVVENDSGGTDHGHGNVMLVAGAGVRGGYHGRWPGLSTGYEADLKVTTDHRQVLAEIGATRFGASTAKVFPGLRYAPLGVVRSG